MCDAYRQKDGTWYCPTCHTSADSQEEMECDEHHKEQWKSTALRYRQTLPPGSSRRRTNTEGDARPI